MRKSEKIAYKVSLHCAKSIYKSEKATAKYAYKLEKNRLNLALAQSETAEHPKPSAKLRQETKAAIRLSRQTYKNRKAQEKNVYLIEKHKAKQTLKKQKKWAVADRAPTSLSFSLAAAYVLVFLLLMVLQGVFVLWTVGYLTDQQSDSKLDTVFSTMAAAEFSEEAATSANTNDISFVALKKGNDVIYQVGEAKVAGSAFNQSEGIHQITVGTVNYRLLCRNTGSGTLYVAKNMQAEDDIFALLLIVMLVATVIAAIASGVVGISVSQSCLRPIHSMSRLMKEMNVSDLSARLDAKRIHTELRDVAIHYNEMMDRLEASYAAEARFVSDASHELRTPLSVISGYGDILQRWGREDPAVLEEAIASINAQCKQMNELLERLLALSRMDHALPELKAAELELYPLVQELTRDFALVAGGREISMEVPKSLRLYCDADMLRQVLVIFLDNAVKFTEEHGEITVFAHEIGQEIRVGVRDNGIGIPSEKLDKIFERFYKADPARGEKGYGLGLSIAAKLGQAMDARITVESAEGKGSAFALCFKKKEGLSRS